MSMMRRIAIFSIFSLLFLAGCNLSYGRSIREKPTASFLEWAVLDAEEACEQTYGFLPCSTNVWGLLFLIVVYEILLSIGGQYVGNGSNLFFQMIGPGVFGASLFQVLGTIPQIVLVLVSALTGSTEAAQQRATLGMGLIAGTTVMLLTLVWGSSVVVGSYNLSETNPADTTGVPQTDQRVLSGLGVVTDAETSYTARIMLMSLPPFIFIVVAASFHSSVRRVVILIALIVTIALLLAYMFYQIFQPSIQNRRFEYLVSKYAKDKILRLLARNGKPDLQKIQALFKSIDRNNNASVSASELRVLLLGLKMGDGNLSTERDVEEILASFDTSGDGHINQDEFIKVMTKLVSDLADQTPDRLKWYKGAKSQTNGQAQQPLLPNNTTTTKTKPSPTMSNSWLNYLTATYYVVVGTAILCALSEPLLKSVIAFAQAANMSSFSVSYLAIPLAMNYGVAIQSITSARQKTQKSISLTLSALYGGVYMNNIIGLIVFLAPVYARNLSSNPTTEAVVVLIICILMTLFASFRTVFSRWMGYIVVSLYPISLAIVYVLTSVLHWS